MLTRDRILIWWSGAACGYLLARFLLLTDPRQQRMLNAENDKWLKEWIEASKARRTQVQKPPDSN